MIFRAPGSLRALIWLLLFSTTYSLNAQKRNGSPESAREKPLNFFGEELDKEDSSLSNFQNYAPLLFAQDLGNLGSPYQFMYHAKPNSIGFSTGRYTPIEYFNSTQNSRYYKASVPYTLASYVTGQRPSNTLDVLQQVSLLHTQNWGPLFNIGIKINNNRCNGFSTNAQAKTSSGQIFVWFHSANNKYQILGNSFFNSATNQLNGGIINDSSYESSSGVSREIAGLITDSSLFRYKSRQYYVRQFYRFGKETQTLVTHSVHRDSLVTDTIRNIEANIQLGHSISFKRDAWVYQDNINFSRGVYQNYYFDSLRTKDTLHQNTLSNIVDILLKPKRNGLIYFAYENRLHWIYSYNTTLLMNESFIRGSYDHTFSSTISFRIKSDYCLFNNYRELSQGDNLSEAEAAVKWKYFSLRVATLLAVQAPTLMQVYYPGNHFYWDKPNLKKTRTASGFVELVSTSKKNSLLFSFSNLAHYTYFDSNITPLHSNSIIYSSMQWKQDFHYQSFRYIHQAIWQQASNASVMPLPKILIKATMMYDDEWFKKALHIQLGVSVSYFTKYDAPAFMPSVNLFYVQHIKQIGNYPQLDGFVTMQIQRVRIFVVMEHFNQGIQGFSTATYITPHYPIPNRSIRFGVSWSFYN